MAMRTEFTHQDPAPRLYNDPSLTPLEFILAVMHDEHLPMATRIQAASAAMPYTNPYPRPTNSFPPRCTIVIGGLGRCDTDHAQGPATDPTRTHSQNPIGANITLTRDGEAGDPVNIETTSYPDFVPDYSTP